MDLFPRPAFYRKNATIITVGLETEGEETEAQITAISVEPIEIGDEIEFIGVVSGWNAEMEIYHGDTLVGTVNNTGGFGRAHNCVSTSREFTYKAVGEGSLIEMTYPSVVRTD